MTTTCTLDTDIHVRFFYVEDINLVGWAGAASFFRLADPVSCTCWLWSLICAKNTTLAKATTTATSS